MNMNTRGFTTKDIINYRQLDVVRGIRYGQKPALKKAADDAEKEAWEKLWLKKKSPLGIVCTALACVADCICVWCAGNKVFSTGYGMAFLLCLLIPAALDIGASVLAQNAAETLASRKVSGGKIGLIVLSAAVVVLGYLSYVNLNVTAEEVEIATEKSAVLLQLDDLERKKGDHTAEREQLNAQLEELDQGKRQGGISKSLLLGLPVLTSLLAAVTNFDGDARQHRIEQLENAELYLHEVCGLHKTMLQSLRDGLNRFDDDKYDQANLSVALERLHLQAEEEQLQVAVELGNYFGPDVTEKLLKADTEHFPEQLDKLIAVNAAPGSLTVTEEAPALQKAVNFFPGNV